MENKVAVSRQVYNDTVYIQIGEPQGVQDEDLNFNTLLKNGHIKTTEGQFVAVAIVSDEMREGVAMANFNYPQAPANSIVHAVPEVLRSITPFSPTAMNEPPPKATPRSHSVVPEVARVQ